MGHEVTSIVAEGGMPSVLSPVSSPFLPRKAYYEHMRKHQDRDLMLSVD